MKKGFPSHGRQVAIWGWGLLRSSIASSLRNSILQKPVVLLLLLQISAGRMMGAISHRAVV